MPKTAKRHFDANLKEKIWGIFWRELDKSSPHVRTDVHLKRFLTENEITILEKRLAALYWLNRGESLRETSRKSGLAKKTVIALKHGFRRPIPRSVRKEKLPENQSRRSRPRVLPYYVSDKLIRDLRRRR
jgi:hypothetical protein